MIHQSIVNLNNGTVELLRHRDYRHALENAWLSLSHHKDLCLASLSQKLPTTSVNVDGCLDTCMFLSEVGRQCSDKAFIYDQAIQIPASTDTGSTMTSAILIFNNALAHHLYAEAMLQGTPQQHLLLRAKDMYELAHRVHPVSTNLLFHFAVINNIALIEAKVGHTEASRTHFQYLMAIIVLLIDQGHTERLHHLQRFLANVITTTYQTAPAA